MQLRLRTGRLRRGIVVVLERDELHHLAPAQDVEREIGGDPVEPGVKLRIRTPLRQCFPCLDENLLSELQRFLARTGEMQQMAIDTVLMLAHERTKGGLVALSVRAEPARDLRARCQPRNSRLTDETNGKRKSSRAA